MSKIQDVSAYICAKYPHREELSKARLTKLVYLVDWKSSQIRRNQITPITWYFHNFGPYVDDVYQEVSYDPRFHIEETQTFYGDSKTLIGIKYGSAYNNGLYSDEIRIIDLVIDETKNLYWDSFIRYVYDTYPVRTTDRYSELDLVTLAHNERYGF